MRASRNTTHHGFFTPSLVGRDLLNIMNNHPISQQCGRNTQERVNQSFKDQTNRLTSKLHNIMAKEQAETQLTSSIGVRRSVQSPTAPQSLEFSAPAHEQGLLRQLKLQ